MEKREIKFRAFVKDLKIMLTDGISIYDERGKSDAEKIKTGNAVKVG